MASEPLPIVLTAAVAAPAAILSINPGAVGRNARTAAIDAAEPLPGERVGEYLQQLLRQALSEGVLRDFRGN